MIVAIYAACSLQIVAVCEHIHSGADSDDWNSMMAMVMITMMIVFIMVIRVPAEIRQADSIPHQSGQTFHQLRDFHRPNVSPRKLNSSRCMQLSAAASNYYTIMSTLSRL